MIFSKIFSLVPTVQFSVQEPLPASNMLDLIPAIIIVLLSVIFLFLSIRLSRLRTDGIGSIYLLTGVFLFLACVFQVIFLFLRSEWLYTFIFVQEVFLLLSLVTLIISALSLGEKAPTTPSTPIEPEKAPPSPPQPPGPTQEVETPADSERSPENK